MNVDDLDVKRLRLEPGDKLVLTTDRTINYEAAQRIKEVVAAVIGDDYPVLVMGDGLKLTVLGPDQQERASQPVWPAVVD